MNAREFLLPLLLLVLPQQLLGQGKERFNPLDIVSPGDIKGLPKTETRTAVATDGPVNPAEYYLGPGDLLRFNIWSSSPVDREITVSPDGTILVPDVGVLDIHGLTLQRAREKLTTLASTRYLKSQTTLTLVNPRKIMVDVRGYVLNEGRHEASAVQRANDVIVIANAFPPRSNLTLEEYGVEIHRMQVTTSERAIVLQRRDGTRLNVDLVMHRVTGKEKYNPYLREGDVVYVPQRKEKDYSLAVLGGIDQSAGFEFVPGDSLSGLVRMGLGWGPRSDPRNAILTRLSEDGRQMDTVHIDVEALMEHRAQDMALRPGDRLIIPQRWELRQNYFVLVEGAVAKPGNYPITHDNTRLSEVIRMAGGIHQDANLIRSVVYRRGTTQMEDEKDLTYERLVSQRSHVEEEDTANYSVETALRLMGELVAVDFVALLARGDTTQDIILKPYDRILISRETGTVYVFGQVVSPGHVRFEKGRAYGDYVDRAGGYTQEALRGGVKIIKARTREWLDVSDTEVEDGDFVWVPRETHYPLSHYITIYAQVASIVIAAATVVLLVRSY